MLARQDRGSETAGDEEKAQRGVRKHFFVCSSWLIKHPGPM